MDNVLQQIANISGEILRLESLRAALVREYEQGLTRSVIQDRDALKGQLEAVKQADGLPGRDGTV